MRSFTLLEVLIIVAIGAILISLTLPIGLDFYRGQQLDTHAQRIIQTLRRAQLKAMSVEDDSNFGVYITDDSYILFRGNSYLTRNLKYDEVFDLPMMINVSGLQEIVFSKLEGKPNVTGEIRLSIDQDIIKISINEVGTISY